MQQRVNIREQVLLMKNVTEYNKNGFKVILLNKKNGRSLGKGLPFIFII